MSTDPSALTRAIRVGIETDEQHGAVVPPLYLSSNFTFAGLDQPRKYDYTRSGNPTRDLVGEAVAVLENGAGGTVVATGMAAGTLVLLAHTKPGDTIAVPHDCYGGSWRLFNTFATNHRLNVEWIDFTQTGAAVERLAEVKPSLVWLETPSNPLLRITDLEVISKAAREVGAIVAVDNTFLTPLAQKPLDLGADIVTHSATKYLNGHSDVVAGVVVAKTPEQHEHLAWWANVLGLTASPFDSYLTLRGLRTIELRFQRHQENTAAIVEAIEGHPAVAALHYPGRAAHPGHDIAAKQQNGFGAMFSLELKGGQDAVARFIDGLELFSLAESLGGVESLVAHPATMTHASMTPEAREVAGVTPGLLRFSVGIEPSGDLIAELVAALDRAV